MITIPEPPEPAGKNGVALYAPPPPPEPVPLAPLVASLVYDALSLILPLPPILDPPSPLVVKTIAVPPVAYNCPPPPPAA